MRGGESIQTAKIQGTQQMRAQPVFWRTGDDYVDLGIDVLLSLIHI